MKKTIALNRQRGLIHQLTSRKLYLEPVCRVPEEIASQLIENSDVHFNKAVDEVRKAENNVCLELVVGNISTTCSVIKNTLNNVLCIRRRRGSVSRNWLTFVAPETNDKTLQVSKISDCGRF